MTKHILLGTLILSLSISAFALPSNMKIVRPTDKRQEISTSVVTPPMNENSKNEETEDENSGKPEEAVTDPGKLSPEMQERLKKAQEQEGIIPNVNGGEELPSPNPEKEIKIEKINYNIYTTDIGIWNKTTIEQLEKKGKEKVENSYKQFLEKNN